MTKKADFETKSVYIIRIKAVFSAGITTETVAEIRIQDANDNAPEVTMMPSSVIVTTNYPVGTVISRALVTDKDTSSQTYSYSIVGGNDRGAFSIDANGMIRIASCIQPREAGILSELKVRVTDGVFQRDTTVMINYKSIGDKSFSGNCGTNCPSATGFGYPYQYYFSKSLYVVTVPENTLLGEIIKVNIRVAGDIKNVQYQIVGGSRYFDLNNNDLVLKTPLDYESTVHYNLRVKALIPTSSNETIESEVGVLIIVTNIDDTPPQIMTNSNILLVSESSVIGQQIAFINVRDPDTQQNQLSYKVIGSSPFSITANGFVIVRSDLMKLSGKLSTLSYEVTDEKNAVSGTLRFQIVKQTYAVSLAESAASETTVVTLQGLVSGWTYYLQNTYSIFAINSNTGVVSLTGTVDFETASSYSIAVMANGTDGFTRHVATIALSVSDVDDNAPTFGTFNPVSVNEFTPTGVVVLQISASDADSNNKMSYVIVGGSSTFSINSLTGAITLLTPLHTNRIASYSLKIRATDVDGLFAETSVVLNVARVNASVLGCIGFSSATNVIDIAESANIGDKIGMVAGNTGSKASSIVYSIDSSSNKWFVITINGTLLLNKSLDYETKSSYIVLITARDTLRNTTATYTLFVNVVDVNEHKPSIAVASLSVLKNAVVGTYVGRILATDGDKNSRIRYSIQAGNTSHQFKIDAISGVITVNGSLSSGVNTLKICASDSSFTECRDIIVTIIAVNEFAPQFNALEFRAAIQTDGPAGTAIIKIKATDKDNTNALMYTMESSSSIIASTFAVNSSTGVLYLKKSNPMANAYVFLVCASDSKFKTCIPISITVASVTSNVPEFQLAAYGAVSKTTDPIGTQLLRVIAQDASKSILEYSIVSGNTAIFAIEQLTGYITLKNATIMEGGKVYELNVSATNAVSRDSGYTQVLIAVEALAVNASTYIKNVNGTQMTVVYNLGTFDQSKIGHYMLLGQQFDQKMDTLNNVLEPVSWYYVNHYSEYQNRRFFIAKLTEEELDKLRKRTRRAVRNLFFHIYNNYFQKKKLRGETLDKVLFFTRNLRYIAHHQF